jgi:hypothetical protein
VSEKLTVAEVERRVEDIRAMAGDDESAHGAEDSLHSDVLAAIANGVCDDSAACAKAALATHDIEFARWCA